MMSPILVDWIWCELATMTLTPGIEDRKWYYAIFILALLMRTLWFGAIHWMYIKFIATSFRKTQSVVGFLLVVLMVQFHVPYNFIENVLEIMFNYWGLQLFSNEKIRHPKMCEPRAQRIAAIVDTDCTPHTRTPFCRPVDIFVYILPLTLLIYLLQLWHSHVTSDFMDEESPFSENDVHQQDADKAEGFVSDFVEIG